LHLQDMNLTATKRATTHAAEPSACKAWSLGVALVAHVGAVATLAVLGGTASSTSTTLDMAGKDVPQVSLVPTAARPTEKRIEPMQVIREQFPDRPVEQVAPQAAAPSRTEPVDLPPVRRPDWPSRTLEAAGPLATPAPAPRPHVRPTPEAKTARTDAAARAAGPTPGPVPRPALQPDQTPVAARPEQSAPTETAARQTLAGTQRDAEVVRLPRPAYPRPSVLRGEEGVVELNVQVLPSGRPGRIQVRQSSGHAKLDEAAVAAARRARFRPALADGRPTPTHLLIPFRFTLR
jgi:protein TonB